jgi:hypothetical protein
MSKNKKKYSLKKILSDRKIKKYRKENEKMEDRHYKKVDAKNREKSDMYDFHVMGYKDLKKGGNWENLPEAKEARKGVRKMRYGRKMIEDLKGGIRGYGDMKYGSKSKEKHILKKLKIKDLKKKKGNLQKKMIGQQRSRHTWGD